MIRWLVCLVLLTPAGAVAISPGSLASLEGEVSVIRDGAVIPSERISEGFALENFDTVNTGKTGRADVRLSAGGLSASLRLDSQTTLYLDVGASREQTVVIELLAGGITAQVASAVGRSALEVRTDMGSFVQAGPGFRVLMAPTGETLVLTKAGKVACRSGNLVIFAEPGTVVEASAGLRTVPVNASTLDAYESSWLTDRKQAMRDGAAGLLRSLGNPYQLQLGRFQRAWDRYQREAGQSIAVQAATTADLRRAASPLERAMPRVLALRGLYDEGLIPPSFELTRGYAAKEFFKAWDLESSDWTKKLALARRMYKQVVEANGQFPATPDLPAITYSSDFFH